ncbi:MAG: VIT1/CCC1 transporter family protein [Pseudomonadota bacterium]
MRHSLTTGFSFGLTSGIITTLGLLVGLSSGTHSKIVVIGGVLTIAIADAFSDAIGIHVSEESENKHTPREIWESTISTFIFKFLTASTFLIPLLIFCLSNAVIISIIWGLSCLSIFSFLMARKQNVNPWKVVFEHLLIATIVVIATHLVGGWIGSIFC